MQATDILTSHRIFKRKPTAQNRQAHHSSNRKPLAQEQHHSTKQTNTTPKQTDEQNGNIQLKTEKLILKHTHEQRETNSSKALLPTSPEAHWVLSCRGSAGAWAGAQLQGLPKGPNCRSLWEPPTSPEAQNMAEKEI